MDAADFNPATREVGSPATSMEEFSELVTKPFHFLIQEQARCMVAVKELQDQVQALQDFRSIVNQSLPEVLANSRVPSSTPQQQQQPPHGLHPSPNAMESPPSTNRVNGRPSSTGRVLPNIRDLSSTSHGHNCNNKSYGHQLNQHGSHCHLQNSLGSSHDSVDYDATLVTGSLQKSRYSGGGGSKRSAQKYVVVAQGKNWLRIRPCMERTHNTNTAAGPDSEMDDSDEPVSTSDSVRSGSDSMREHLRGRNGRQDSGFSTDRLGNGYDQADRSSSTLPEPNSWVAAVTGSSGKDELLSLFMAIEAKALELRGEIDFFRMSRTENVVAKDSGRIEEGCVRTDVMAVGEESSKGKAVSDPGTHMSTIRRVSDAREKASSFGGFRRIETGAMCPIVDTGLQQKELLSKLEQLRMERDQLLERLTAMEQRVLESNDRAVQMEERLRLASSDREKLNVRIHDMHLQFVRNNGNSLTKKETSPSEPASRSPSGGTNSSSSQPSSFSEDILQGKVHVKPNMSRISSVLHETRFLEVQKQLLTSIMENEVLKTQLEQITKDCSRRSKEQQREVDAAQQDARFHRAAVDRMRLEFQMERTRLRMLQRAIQGALVDGKPLHSHLAQSLMALGHSLAVGYKDQATSTQQDALSRHVHHSITPKGGGLPQVKVIRPQHIESIPRPTQQSKSVRDAEDKMCSPNHKSGCREWSGVNGTKQSLSCSQDSLQSLRAVEVRPLQIGIPDRNLCSTPNSGKTALADVPASPALSSIRKDDSSAQTFAHWMPSVARELFPNSNVVDPILSPKQVAMLSWNPGSSHSLIDRLDIASAGTRSLGAPKKDGGNGIVAVPPVSELELQKRLQSFLQRISEQLVPSERPDEKEFLETGL